MTNKKYQIYHVDDCDFMQELILGSFEEIYNVKCINPITSNFKKPSELISSHKEILNSDLIITDYNMVFFNGLDLSMKLRENNYRKPICCFSGEKFTEEKIKKLSSLEVQIYGKHEINLLANDISNKLK